VIAYRFLERSEHGKVASIFARENCAITPTMRIFVGEDDGEIVSFQCLHQVWHAGPVWVKPELRGRGLWLKMQRQFERTLPSGFSFYQFGTMKNGSQLRRLGLHPLGWTVWLKVKE
jgi:hypothetical protein